MSDINEIAKEYPGIANYITELNNQGFPTSIFKGNLMIKVPGNKKKLVLSPKELSKLDRGDLLCNFKSLTYHGDHGITFGNYSEFYISLNHPDYPYLGADFSWPIEKFLKFKIQDILVTVSSASYLLALLTELHFRNSDFHQQNFTWFPSVRLIGVTLNQAREYFHKAIYYLNSQYFKSLKIYVTLHGVSVDFEDPLGIYYDIEEYGINDPNEIFKRITRERLRKRDDFQSDEPLMLYNYACLSSGTNQFLSFYRVLEFFFRRNLLRVIDEYRHNSNYTSEDIFSLATSKSEADQLLQLIKATLTQSQNYKLSRYAKKYNLIKSETIKDLCNGLYAFRNSLVHSKEKEIANVNLPDPFLIQKQLNQWIYIVRECADSAIKKLNTKKR